MFEGGVNEAILTQKTFDRLGFLAKNDELILDKPCLIRK